MDLLSTRSAHKYLNQCRQTVNQSRSFIFDQIGSTYRIIPIFQYSGETKPAYRPAGSPAHNRRDEITLGRRGKKVENLETAICFQASRCALSGGFIHQSCRGCTYCSRSRTELFDVFHAGVKNTTFWLIPGAHDSELRTERGKRGRDQCSRQIAVRSTMQRVAIKNCCCRTLQRAPLSEHRRLIFSSSHRIRYVTMYALITNKFPRLETWTSNALNFFYSLDPKIFEIAEKNRITLSAMRRSYDYVFRKFKKSLSRLSKFTTHKR